MLNVTLSVDAIFVSELKSASSSRSIVKVVPAALEFVTIRVSIPVV